MTQKDVMLREVLNNEELMSYYHYTMDDVSDLDVYEAQNADNPIIAAVARIIKELDSSSDPNRQNEVYKKIFNYLNNNLLL
jgi:hypothetical protein